MVSQGFLSKRQEKKITKMNNKKSRMAGVDLTNVQSKAIGKYHKNFPLYNKYVLIRLERKEAGR
jgi:hypothetical protein